ncbi:MAG: DUF4252 domain-containing protein [Muribaculaceae bacterium]|nr:DUF4252 domain-containing protein [Muribaculaceae bacterium]
MKQLLLTVILIALSAFAPSVKAAETKEYTPASRTALVDACRESRCGIKTVYIGRSMLGMVRGKHLNIGEYAFEKIIGKIEDLSVISADEKMAMDMLNLLSQSPGGLTKKDKYDVILEIYDDGEHLTIYERKLPNNLNEFALKIERDNSLTIIQISGSLTKQDLQRIKQQKSK